jgi:hypothetical protein
MLSCVLVLARRLRRTKSSFLFTDLTISILLAIVWMAVLILSHASAGAIEIVAAFSIAQIIEAIVTAGLDKQRGRHPRKNGP